MMIETSDASLFVSDQIPLEYDKSKATLFFLYGLGCSIHHWKYQIEALKKGRRIVWMDYQEHGQSKSKIKDRRLTMDILARDIGTVINQLKLDQVVLLGQSMGGTLALKVGLNHPKVKGVVLLGAPARSPSLTMQFHPAGLAVWKTLGEVNRYLPWATRSIYRAAPLLKPLALEIVRSQGFNPELSQTDDINTYIEELLKIDPPVFWDLAHDLEKFDFFQLDKNLNAPALVLAGAYDRLVPLAEAKRTAQRLSRGELHVFEQASHCPHFDDPNSVNRVIENFLQKNRL